MDVDDLLPRDNDNRKAKNSDSESEGLSEDDPQTAAENRA